MNFSSLVLMERDKESGLIVGELGSYEVTETAEFVSKFYAEANIVYIYFDTKDDVEEWEYTAIFDNFNEEVFTDKGYNIESVEDEFNPTWKVSFPFNDEHSVVNDKLIEACSIFFDELNRTLEAIKSKKDEYI